MGKEKKKLKDTAVGRFLAQAGSGIINNLGDVLPDKGVMGLVKNLIKKDQELPPEDKEKALALLHQDTIEMQEVSKRWSSDMKSDSWLSKNVRPMVLVFLIVCTMLLIFIDAGAINFNVKDSYVDLLQLVLITVIGAYFGGRSLEKVKK